MPSIGTQINLLMRLCMYSSIHYYPLTVALTSKHKKVHSFFTLTASLPHALPSHRLLYSVVCAWSSTELISPDCELEWFKIVLSVQEIHLCLGFMVTSALFTMQSMAS